MTFEVKHCRRVYTVSGKVAHLLPFGRSPNDTASTAVCGVWGGLPLWRGTGNQTEEDTAAALRTCKSCIAWSVKEEARRARVKAAGDSWYAAQQNIARGDGYGEPGTRGAG